MNEAKKKIIVKYKYGKTPFNAYGGSASMVRQVLEIIQSELVALCGNYKWSLEGDTHNGYSVVAHYRGGVFVEGRGDTPAQALRDFYGARTVLQASYEGFWK